MSDVPVIPIIPPAPPAEALTKSAPMIPGAIKAPCAPCKKKREEAAALAASKLAAAKMAAAKPSPVPMTTERSYCTECVIKHFCDAKIAYEEVILGHLESRYDVLGNFSHIERHLIKYPILANRVREIRRSYWESPLTTEIDFKSLIPEIEDMLLSGEGLA